MRASSLPTSNFTARVFVFTDAKLHEMGAESAFARAAVRKPGGFGASTAARFKEPRELGGPSSLSYSPEKGKNYVTQKHSASTSGGGFGASKASRFGNESRAVGPSATSYSPENGKNYVAKKGGSSISGGGFGASKASRFGDGASKASASSKSPARKALERAGIDIDYPEVLRSVEASVQNPPPTLLGVAAQDGAWLSQNASADGVVILPTGLQYKELTRGRAGRSPMLDSPCECAFESFLVDGTLFDSSAARGARSFECVPSKMIDGLTVALQLMGEGDTWELYVPPHMAYGDEGRGRLVHAGAVLVFVLTLIKVRGPSRAKAWRPAHMVARGESTGGPRQAEGGDEELVAPVPVEEDLMAPAPTSYESVHLASGATAPFSAVAPHPRNEGGESTSDSHSESCGERQVGWFGGLLDRLW